MTHLASGLAHAWRKHVRRPCFRCGLPALLAVLAACGSAPDIDSSDERIARFDDGRVQVPARSEAFLEVAPVTIAGGDGDSPPTVSRVPGRVEFREGGLFPVGAPVEGRIDEVWVGLGDAVAAGDPLLTLHSPSAARIRAERRQTELRVGTARAELDRQRLLAQRGIGIERDLIAATNALAEAEADLARAERAAQFLGLANDLYVVTVSAPAAGIVVQRMAAPGALVEAGSPLLEIGDAERPWIRAEVFEADLALLQVGAPAQVEIGALSAPLSGKVVRIGAVIDSRLRRAPVYVELDAPHSALRPGMFARVALRSAAAQGVLVPPSAVLIEDGRKHVVYVREPDGLYGPREVRIGRTLDGLTRVYGGLEPGDEVVVAGALLIARAAEQLLY